jgi:hypothetical protein
MEEKSMHLLRMDCELIANLINKAVNDSITLSSIEETNARAVADMFMSVRGVVKFSLKIVVE